MLEGTQALNEIDINIGSDSNTDREHVALVEDAQQENG